MVNSPKKVYCGGVLLSRDLPIEVPSPRPGLTARFGMETGCLPGAMTAAKSYSIIFSVFHVTAWEPVSGRVSVY